ncbi:hypothetical protein [Streptosporangium sp. KLBMP 9127]|nr:hypothetical protein [Streptosporangium sp. KLBMP 9127]
MRRYARILLVLLLAVPMGCGIEPSGVLDRGSAPVISANPTFVTVYLLREGRLEPRRVSAASSTIEDIVDALFKASEPPPPGLKSGLAGFTHADSQTSRYGQAVRNDPEVPGGLRLHVFVRGDGGLSRAALAQITCTTMGLPERRIWVVQVTQISSSTGTPRSWGEHVCSEFRDLASPDDRLPP